MVAQVDLRNRSAVTHRDYPVRVSGSLLDIILLLDDGVKALSGLQVRFESAFLIARAPSLDNLVNKVLASKVQSLPLHQVEGGCGCWPFILLFQASGVLRLETWFVLTHDGDLLMALLGTLGVENRVVKEGCIRDA